MRILFSIGMVLTSCYASVSDQDRAALQTAEKLSESAYCHLARVSFDTDAGDVAVARALQRGGHAELAAALRRSGVQDAGVEACPP